MLDALTKRWFYLCASVFVAVLGIGFYYYVPYVVLIPFVILFFWAAFYRLENVLFFVVMFTPLSINLEEMEVAGIGMYLPTEPILFGVLILFIMKMLSGKCIDKKILSHPVSYVLYAYLVWMALTCITSEYPLVSLKFLLTRMWFIASFYFLAIHMFGDYSKIRKFLLFYIFPLMIVILYTVIRHSFYGFDKDSAHWVMEPLFKDHTSYGAVLAMFFPIIIGLLLEKNMNLLLKVLLGISFAILVVGLIFSYTRAAWISIIAAALILVFLILKIKIKTILLATTVAGAFLLLGWEDIAVSLEQNKQESSDNLDEHVSSISNVTSDASNLERLNRWNCAFEMFKERPIVGWGPGTYQFVYAPFQRSKDRTIISTNQGNGGNAHSEYLGPLCEEGFMGTILFFAILASVSHLAFRLFFTIHEHRLKIIVASVYLGLMTYFIHGVLNNYLDTDKASVPFWGFIAILVSIDLYHKKDFVGIQIK